MSTPRLSFTTSSSSSSPRTPHAAPSPRCFKCGNDSSAYKLAFWIQQQVWIWHCSAEKRNGGTGNGMTFCGHWFIEEVKEPKCKKCGEIAEIDRHGDRYGFRCPVCKVFE